MSCLFRSDETLAADHATTVVAESPYKQRLPPGSQNSLNTSAAKPVGKQQKQKQRGDGSMRQPLLASPDASYSNSDSEASSLMQGKQEPASAINVPGRQVPGAGGEQQQQNADGILYR